MESGELLKHALTLSDKERAELASSLIDSLDPTVDADAELAWQEEIARRLEEVENGRMKNICRHWLGIKSEVWTPRWILKASFSVLSPPSGKLPNVGRFISPAAAD